MLLTILIQAEAAEAVVHQVLWEQRGLLKLRAWSWRIVGGLLVAKGGRAFDVVFIFVGKHIVLFAVVDVTVSSWGSVLHFMELDEGWTLCAFLQLEMLVCSYTLWQFTG